MLVPEDLLNFGQQPWRVVQPGYAIKMFPSQFGTHFVITAGLALPPADCQPGNDPFCDTDRAADAIRGSAESGDRTRQQIQPATRAHVGGSRRSPKPTIL
jgi:hypothetical protein